MKFLINNKFKKSVPFEMRDIIEKKIYDFTYSISKSISNLQNIQKSFWIKKIHSKNFFEFRVNSGDRIIFDIKDNCIRYIYFSKHDRATEKYEKLKLNNFKELIIETEEYVTEDNKIKEYNYEEIDYIPELDYVVENNIEVFKQILESDESKLLHCLYLNDEQIKVLNSNFPIIVTGGAGSGKSAVIFNKMLALEKENKALKIAYFTLSKSLKNDIKNTMSKINKKSKIEFNDLNSYIKKSFNLKKSLADFDIFKLFYSTYKDNIDISEEVIYSEINGIIKGMCSNGWKKDNINISLEEYLNLNDTYTILNNENRIKVFNIFEEYQEYLKINNSYDTNDICYKYMNNNNEKYDYIFIDEVQDLTETQIIFIKKLLKKETNLFLAGDIHQLITMNNFKFDRLNTLFDTKINKYYLQSNYRSSKEIIDISNNLKKLRKKYIGSFNLETELPENSILEGGKATFIDKKELVNGMIKYDANLIVITATEKSKKEALSLLNLNEFENDIVFDIKEVKGLEFKKVICYNLFSDFENEWEFILNGNAKRNQIYRYFFNILYVSITRSKFELYIIEDKSNNIFQELLLNNNIEKLELEFSEEKEFENKSELLENTDNILQSKISRNKYKKINEQIRLYYKETKLKNLVDNTYNRIIFFSLNKYEEALLKTLIKLKNDFDKDKVEIYIDVLISANSYLALKYFHDEIFNIDNYFNKMSIIEKENRLQETLDYNNVYKFIEEIGLYKKYKINVMHNAIIKENVEQLEFFLTKGYDVNKKLLSKDTPLCLAVYTFLYNYKNNNKNNNTLKIIEILLQKGAVLENILGNIETLLNVHDKNIIELFKILKQYGLDLKTKIFSTFDNENLTLFELIIFTNREDILDIYINEDIVNDKIDNNTGYIMLIIYSKSINILKKFIKYGANLEEEYACFLKSENDIAILDIFYTFTLLEKELIDDIYIEMLILVLKNKKKLSKTNLININLILENINISNLSKDKKKEITDLIYETIEKSKEK